VELGGGAVDVRMTRNVDSVTYGTVAGRNALDLNADEALHHVDLVLGTRDFLSPALIRSVRGRAPDHLPLRLRNRR
jgi:hypothetical protein